MSKLKGFSVVGLIVVLAAVAIVAAIIYFGFGGFGFGGGKGDGEGEGDSTVAAVSPDEPEETEATEATEETTDEAIPVIEEIEYVNITVSENEYLYQNSKYSLEELLTELDSIPDNLPVKITDDNASLNAYRQLIEALDEHGIKYIEENMN